VDDSIGEKPTAMHYGDPDHLAPARPVELKFGVLKFGELFAPSTLMLTLTPVEKGPLIEVFWEAHPCVQ